MAMKTIVYSSHASIKTIIYVQHIIYFLSI